MSHAARVDVCERELGELLDSLRTNEQIHVPQKRCSTPMDSPSPAHGATELPTPPEPHGARTRIVRRVSAVRPGGRLGRLSVLSVGGLPARL